MRVRSEKVRYGPGKRKRVGKERVNFFLCYCLLGNAGSYHVVSDRHILIASIGLAYYFDLSLLLELYLTVKLNSALQNSSIEFIYI